MRTRVSVYAIAGTKDSLLLTRLSENSPIFTPGLWHLPGGGVDPGEQPEEALARELREETGLELLGAELAGTRSYTAHRLGVTWHLVAVFYRVDLRPGLVTVTETSGSTSEVSWKPLAGLDLRTLSPAAIDGLALWREQQSRGTAGPRS